jgi:fido (protein-threonine AMPylation protein)
LELALADERDTAALRLALAELDGIGPEQLDLNALVTIHRILLSPTHPYAGQLRSGEAFIRIRGRVPKPLPDAGCAELLAIAALEWLKSELGSARNARDSVRIAADAMYLLVKAHPFLDGNGRVARAIAAWVLYRGRYEVAADPSKYFRDRAVECHEAISAREGSTGKVSDPEVWYRFFSHAVRIYFRPPAVA